MVDVFVVEEVFVLGEFMDIFIGLQMVLKKVLVYDGFVKGLYESVKVIEKYVVQMCVLVEDCNQFDYMKLVQVFCQEYNVNLVLVFSVKKFGEWVGLCKIDFEGKVWKVVGCFCVVVKDYGEEIEGLNVVREYFKNQQQGLILFCFIFL